MANGLLLRLRERELSASPAERNVIAYVSAHPHEVVGLSVRGLADVTFSSPSSILRFCKRLGFAGYKEFQRELIAELALLGDKKDVALEDISTDDSVERIVGKVMKSNVRTIEATARTLDYTVLERCAARLKRARAVNLFGIGASRLVAHDRRKSSCVSTKSAICTTTGMISSYVPRTCMRAIWKSPLVTRA